MTDKITNVLYGSLLVIALTSPPQFLKFSILDLSEFSIIILTFLIFLKIIKQYPLKKLYELFINSYWFYITLLFSASFILYGVNTLTIRFIFYTIFGFLVYVFLTITNLKNLEYFLLPIWSITLLNLITFIFELSFVGNTLGWISFFYEDPSFFNRGRLAGYQGGGPNVAGLLTIFIVYLSIYFYLNTKKIYYLVISFINLFLLFITFSRGSYLAFVVTLIIILFYKKIVNKNAIIGSFSFLLISLFFVNFINPQIFLKESDRGYLTNIALDNISIIKGVGGGNYVNEIYGKYFLSINPKILEENLNIKLDKVELGITPEEYRNSGVEFFIGTSGGGYELLQQANIADKCSEDRITCQHVRVNYDILVKFISSVFDQEPQLTKNLFNSSDCLDLSNEIKTRKEFYCLIAEMLENSSRNQGENKLTNDDFFVSCEKSALYKCENRQLAIGELAVLVEKLVYRDAMVPESNFKKFCTECEFRNVTGFIKIIFDKRDKILPRSKISFFTSPNGEDWEQVGFSRTTGNIITFNQNSSYLEIGGHSDGQSFGNTFLDGVINSLIINSNQISKEIIFTEEKQNNEYFVFKPNSENFYTSNITYENNGIKLFRPNKYWLAVNNNFDFNEDFEIILELSFPEIPWETQTLISSTSIFNNQIQSWRIDIDDGRLFFTWTDENGVFIKENIIGDKSLRSGILIQNNGKISNAKSPIVDPSFLSQLTTAHNGYLTFAVEYGLLFSALFFGIIIKFVLNMYRNIDDENFILYLCLVAFFVQNFTNDMLYSADIFIVFNLIFSIIYFSTKSFSERKV